MKTDEQWRSQLTAEEYAVLRQAATEAPFVGEYTDNHRTGIYRCRACGSELFRSDAKFDSHCGWPSFFTPLAGDKVIEIEDRSFGSGPYRGRLRELPQPLGHVFAGEGFDTPTDLRYCINSISMTFEDTEPRRSSHDTANRNRDPRRRLLLGGAGSAPQAARQ